MRPFDAGFNYMLGDFMYVSAINGPQVVRRILFPHGTWIDFWDGTEYQGGSVADIEYPLDRYPVFIKKGAIIPLDLREESVFARFDQDLPPLTVSLYPSAGETVQFDVFEEKGTGARIECEFGTTITIRLSATTRDYAFRVIGAWPALSVESSPFGKLNQATDLDDLKGMDSGWAFLNDERELWVKPGNSSGGQIITIR
jgi:alpha-glucosidase (family GH31 glycosyl hydrolase)